MIILLVTMQILGTSLTINAEKLYGTMNMRTCKELLPLILWDYQATEGFCWKGDILNNPPQKI
jgi:hypothetical protein